MGLALSAILLLLLKAEKVVDNRYKPLLVFVWATLTFMALHLAFNVFGPFYNLAREDIYSLVLITFTPSIFLVFVKTVKQIKSSPNGESGN